jgi:hypothetical protein
MDEGCRARSTGWPVAWAGPGLGWAGPGLGAVWLAVPNAVRRMARVDDSSTVRILVPTVGVRELAHAVFLPAVVTPAAGGGREWPATPWT